MQEWEPLAQAGNPNAQHYLGIMYEYGHGLERDDLTAAQWYKRAAHRGHALAQHALAYMYLNGTGVPQDKIQAYKWLKIASETRADLMTKHLSNVSKTMTSAEILQAERLAIAWLNAQDI